MKNYFLLSVLLIFLSANLLLADDMPSNSNGNSSTKNSNSPDLKAPNQKSVDISQKLELDKQLKQAIESGNKNLETQIRTQINQLSTSNQLDPKFLSSEYRDEIITSSNSPAFNPDWMNNDVLIYSGDIGEVETNHFRTDVIMGKDGWLYVGFIRRPEAGTNGRLDVYRSQNGGLSWIFVGAAQSATAYFGQISLTVNIRGNTPDSTRITVFYSRSTNNNFNDATINWVSFRRDGSGVMGGIPALSPAAGNKLLFPNAVSDGQYWTAATYINVICIEYNNAGTQTIGIRNGRTTDWGLNFTSTSINTGYPAWTDWFPSAAFKKGTTLATDSIYIAVERRFGAPTTRKVRIIATTQTPSAGFFLHAFNNSTDSLTRPSMTIEQNASALDKKIFVAYILNPNSLGRGQARYGRSINSGQSWITNSILGLVTEDNVEYVSVSSDSNSTSGGNFIACYQKGLGDTIVIRRGILGSLGDRVEKPNEFRSSIYNSPKVAIYNSHGNLFSTLLYTGISASNYTSNVYFDQQNLPTNVEPVSNNLAESYSLSQNFPNPFNPETNINFNIPTHSLVKLVVYDMLGKEVATLVNQNLQAGSYEITFNASKLTSGVYFYKLSSGDFNDVKKMILVK